MNASHLETDKFSSKHYQTFGEQYAHSLPQEKHI
jgi:hypothetical protein